MLNRVETWFLNNHRHRQLHARLDSILPSCLGQYSAPRGFVINRISSGLHPTLPCRVLEGELQEIIEALE